MALKTKYPNCRHNFGRIRPVTSFYDFGGKNTFSEGKYFCFSSAEIFPGGGTIDILLVVFMLLTNGRS